jgi:hypothetical protein
MAAGLVSHSITTAAGVTFGVISWVPDTSAPDVGAVPVARITDGTNVAPVSSTNGLKVDVAVLPAITGTVAISGTPNVAITGTPAVTISGTPSVTAAATLAAETTKKIGVVGIDPTQLGSLVAGGVPVVSGGNDWLWIDVSNTNTTLTSTTTGSYLEEILAVVTNAATCQVQIKDGSGTARTILPNNSVGGIGVYPIPLGLVSKLGAWQVSTAGGVTVIASFHV